MKSKNVPDEEFKEDEGIPRAAFTVIEKFLYEEPWELTTNDMITI